MKSLSYLNIRGYVTVLKGFFLNFLAGKGKKLSKSYIMTYFTDAFLLVLTYFSIISDCFNDILSIIV